MSAGRRRSVERRRAPDCPDRSSGSEASDRSFSMYHPVCLDVRPDVEDVFSPLLSVHPSTIHLSLRPYPYVSLSARLHVCVCSGGCFISTERPKRNRTTFRSSSVFRPSVCLSVHPSVCLSVRISVCLSVCPSVCLYVRPHFRLYLCLFVCRMC